MQPKKSLRLYLVMQNEGILSDNFFVAPSNGILICVLGFAYGIVSYYEDLELDFSNRINSFDLINADIMSSFYKRINQIQNDEQTILYKEEMLQFFTWNYIAAICSADKELFFKWFLDYDKPEDNPCKNAEEFRKWLFFAQSTTLTFYKERKEIWNKTFVERKKILEEIFGIIEEQ